MSRHTHHPDERTELAGGYDRPLQNFFFQKYVDGEIVYSISTDQFATLKQHPDYPGKMAFARSELAEIMALEGAPQAWVEAIVLDLPF